ncbi:MAG: hypothetical protein A2X52_14805 [Candidatus Rokubacteria bacterium GWC2_70_16]|nr:MAG: hypothetical protein A2X52_14805 [Candidatus Rokubacteria bacterium GWC2_70_16]
MRLTRAIRVLCAVTLGGLAPLWLLAAIDSHAGDLKNEPASFRISLALDRGSIFTDVAGLSASAAYPYGSSTNPAADDFLRQPPNEFTLAGTLTGNYIAFTSGASITAGAASASYRLPETGTLTLGFTRADSHGAKSHEGDGFGLRSNELSLAYSHRLGERLSVGGEVKLSESTLNISGTLADLPLRADSDSLGIDGRVGVLLGLGEQWLVGLLAGAGSARGHTTGAWITPDPPFGFGPQRFRLSDEITSVTARLGLGWRPSEKFGAYADWQYLGLSGNTNSAEVGRMFGGLEYLPVAALALRLGGSLDTDRQATVSGGLGFYLFKNFQAEMAYGYNAFPEVRREFGRAHLLSASLVLVY